MSIEDGFKSSEEQLNKSSEIDQFRIEIERIKQAEIAGSGTAHMTQNGGVEVIDLTEEDMHMYKRVKDYRNSPVPRRDLQKYKEEVINSRNKSRMNFYAYLANLFLGASLEVELSEEQ